MNRNRITLSIVVILSVMSLGLFLYGFVIGVADVLFPQSSDMAKPEEDTPPLNPEDDKLNMVFLGDSITRGVGDREGMGYVGRVKQALEQEEGWRLSVNNLAVSGATSEDLIDQLQQDGIQYALSRADVIVLTIGGNDLHPGWDELDTIDFSQYRGDVEGFSENAARILDLIRAVNPDSPIYWIGLYNPFEDIPELTNSAAIVQNWNANLEKMVLSHDRVYYVPVFDLFRGQTDRLLYTDHFHPSAEGYELIATRVLERIMIDLDQNRREDERDE
ncbi:MAG: lipase [Bacillaceae bacterium]|nr:lipase [Bacillaceae bacterium]